MASQAAAAKSAHEPLQESALAQWKLVEDFRRRLQAAGEKVPAARTEGDPRRQLLSADYFALLLLGLFNPVVRTMRGLCAASALGRVQKDICSRRVSLGSFSEAQDVFAPELLEEVFQELAREVSRRGESLSGRTPGQWQALALDSTLLRALPRMAWALWRHQGKTQRAVRLHVKFDLAAGAPVEATITPGATCERATWRKVFKKDELYVGDRYYGQDYALLAEARAAGCAFVVRLRERQSSLRVVEELPLREEDEAARVTRAARVMVGSKKEAGPFVLVEVAGERGPLRLLSSLEAEELPAHAVAVLYRQRWMVELFFRWIKCLLGCRHWLAESARGVAMQIYCALIGALLLALYTGKAPGKRAMELLQFYLLGYATLEEVCRQLGIKKKA